MAISGDVEGVLIPWSPLRLNSKFNVEMKAMRDGWTKFQSPAGPGKEVGTEAGVQTQAPGHLRGPRSRHGCRQGPLDAAVLCGLLFKACPGSVVDEVASVAISRLLTQARQRQSCIRNLLPGKGSLGYRK